MYIISPLQINKEGIGEVILDQLLRDAKAGHHCDNPDCPANDIFLVLEVLDDHSVKLKLARVAFAIDLMQGVVHGVLEFQQKGKEELSQEFLADIFLHAQEPSDDVLVRDITEIIIAIPEDNKPARLAMAYVGLYAIGMREFFREDGGEEEQVGQQEEPFQMPLSYNPSMN